MGYYEFYFNKIFTFCHIIFCRSGLIYTKRIKKQVNKINQENILPEELIIRFLTKNASQDDLVSLRLWLNESSSNQRLYDEICDLWLASKQILHKNEFDPQNAWQKTNRFCSFDQQLNQELQVNKDIQFKSGFFIHWRKVAAIFIFFFIAGSIVTYLTMNNISQINIHAYTEHYVPFGSKSLVTLPDGTRVWINSGSRLRYSQNFNIIDRRVTLDGEAYFDVHKNALKPFFVKTSGVTIKVLGTAFNVKAYRDEKTIETTVERGLVQIYSNNSAQKNLEGVLLHPKQKATYEMGEIAISKDIITTKTAIEIGKQKQPSLEINSLIIKNDVLTELATSWKDTRWIIEREKLKDLAVKIERRYNVKIEFADLKLKSFVFSGVLDDESLEQVLEVIKLSAPVRYTLKQAKVIFYENKAFKNEN